MPRSTMSHRDKKDGQAHDAWGIRKTAANAGNELKQLEQKYWRKDCLLDRIQKLTFAKKNEKEANALGYELQLDISGWPVGLRNV